MPLDDVCNLLGDFPREAFNFFFEPAITGGMVYADDYVRFATWFKSIGGFGQEYKNVSKSIGGGWINFARAIFLTLFIIHCLWW